jgi:trehalose 6-phosphate synthase
LGDAGVLILSEFAGAAQELKSALQVNPYDIDQIASALHQAVEMPIEERQERMAQMRQSIEANDLDSWSQKFLGALVQGHKRQIDARLAIN